VSSDRARVVRRLRSLRTLEWVNIGWLGAVLLVLTPGSAGSAIPSETWQRSLAFVPLALLLLLGGWYWHRRLLRVTDGTPLGPALPALDRGIRGVRVLLLVLSLALVVSWATRTGATVDRAWATFLLAFAWGEYVNYVHVQLMYDTRHDLRRLRRTRRLRPAQLGRDLARYRASDRGAGGGV
jgi:hypothetical protein